MGRHLRILAFAVLLPVLLGAVAGCGTKDVSTRPAAPVPLVPTAPAPDSPTDVLTTFQWSWEHKDINTLSALLTTDFRFVFAQTDSSGDAFVGHSLTRDEFLLCARRLFTGGEGSPLPPAQRITLYFDANPLALPDSRKGKDPTVHKEIRTSVDLTVDLGTEVYRVTGYARFYVVRRDSAMIPPDTGLHSGTHRWYIERWEDETGSGAGGAAVAVRPAQPMPARNTTWGEILMFYFGAPAQR